MSANLFISDRESIGLSYCSKDPYKETSTNCSCISAITQQDKPQRVWKVVFETNGTISIHAELKISSHLYLCWILGTFLNSTPLREKSQPDYTVIWDGFKNRNGFCVARMLAATRVFLVAAITAAFKKEDIRPLGNYQPRNQAPLCGAACETNSREVPRVAERRGKIMR